MSGCGEVVTPEASPAGGEVDVCPDPRVHGWFEECQFVGCSNQSVTDVAMWDREEDTGWEIAACFEHAPLLPEMRHFTAKQIAPLLARLGAAEAALGRVRGLADRWRDTAPATRTDQAHAVLDCERSLRAALSGAGERHDGPQRLRTVEWCDTCEDYHPAGEHTQ